MGIQLHSTRTVAFLSATLISDLTLTYCSANLTLLALAHPFRRGDTLADTPPDGIPIGVSHFITSPDLGHPPVCKGMLREASYLSISTPVTGHVTMKEILVSIRPNREAIFFEEWLNTAGCTESRTAPSSNLTEKVPVNQSRCGILCYFSATCNKAGYS